MAAKHIVITGAGRGLGLAMAAGFSERGHTVSGCSQSAESVQALKSRFGAAQAFERVDVTDDAQVQEWAATVLAKHGPPDLLLNNAAIVNRNAPLWQVSAAEFGQVIDVNIKGVFHVLRHFLPAMIGRGKGVIVNFSSGWGRSTSPEVAPYCATKYAIEGLTLALAAELPKGLAAVPLNPGVINTDMLQSCFGGGATEYPSPEEWAKKSVPFLLQLGPRDNGQSLSVPS